MGDFYAGVIEGFYGPPWTQAERMELFDWMTDWGLNTYFYAPKDDLKHRAQWRELHDEREAGRLREVAEACQRRKIRLVYGLGPGLDLRYADPAELRRLAARFEQVLHLGCTSFALLFDDIPDRMHPDDARRFGSFASAQAHAANAMHRWSRERGCGGAFFFCPTPYCGRMARAGLGGADYLDIAGRELAPEIDVFWTGPEIVSETIDAGHIRGVAARLRRAPVIWDNLHANDYDGRRFYCGPYEGRSVEMVETVRGILSNPNTEFPLNFVPLQTLGRFVKAALGEQPWSPRDAYLDAMEEWAARAGVECGGLVRFGDCYYLPYSDGPEADALFACAGKMLASPAAAAEFAGRAERLREFCAKLAELRDRPLFHALSRRAWELREELDLLEKFACHAASGRGDPFRSDFHLPKTYRGGFVPRLQRLLRQEPDGSFTPHCAAS
jgi:protein O-GlcNAcase/histone acetyltransferase